MSATLRISGAAALLVAATVHVAQLVSIFHAVAWVGPLFAADALASAAIAVALLTTRGRLAPAAGALVSAGALGGLVLSSTVGFLGWQEAALRPAVVIAIASELAAVAALAPLALPAPPRLAPAWRAAAGAGLVAVAALHVAAAGDEWADARGVFWLFMGLAGVCAAVTARLALGLDRWARPAVAATAVAAIAGYLLSRTTGLPGATDDIGDWANPLGLAALAVETALIACAAAAPRLEGCRSSSPASHTSTRQSGTPSSRRGSRSSSTGRAAPHQRERGAVSG
jgi:hypothetical protein